MGQVFWEQIRNELPDAGEFLTGSLGISGSFSTTGSLTVELNGVNEVFKVSVEGNEKFRVNTQGATLTGSLTASGDVQAGGIKTRGILELVSQSSTPTAIQGGMFYSASNDFFFGFY